MLKGSGRVRSRFYSYDGLYKYSYDAWNRPVKVARAYRDGQGALQAGSTIATMQYDGLGRRIVKAITNSADWDCDYNYYWDGWRMIETRNGSDEVLRQQVYGRGYVDELVQIGINQDPSNANSQSNAENDCERFVYVLQDANYNVLGVATSTGRVIERYEYTPYGQRTIFSHGWLRADIDDDGFVGQGDLDIVLGDWGHTGAGIANPCADLSGDGSVGQGDMNIVLDAWGDALPSDDPLVSMAVLASGQGRDGLAAGLCDFGHQGLMHDREFSLVYNRMRYLDPVLARFMTTDPAGYTDGMNGYERVKSSPMGYVDWIGMAAASTTQPSTRPAPTTAKSKALAALQALLAVMNSRGPTITKASGLLALIGRLTGELNKYPHFEDLSKTKAASGTFRLKKAYWGLGKWKGSFHWQKNSNKYGSVTVFHESIHALDFSSKWYLPDDNDRAERLTYSAEMIYSFMASSVHFERDVRNKRIPTRKITPEWKGMWLGTNKLWRLLKPNAQYWVGDKPGILSAQDIADAERKLGFYVSCSKFQKAISQTYNIPKKCLPCPKTLSAPWE